MQRKQAVACGMNVGAVPGSVGHRGSRALIVRGVVESASGALNFVADKITCYDRLSLPCCLHSGSTRHRKALLAGARRSLTTWRWVKAPRMPVHQTGCQPCLREAVVSQRGADSDEIVRYPLLHAQG